MLSVKEVSELLSVTEKTVYRWINANTIPYTRVGNQYRFSREDILAWSMRSGRKPGPEILIEPVPESGKAELPKLSEAINRGGIYYNIEGDTPENIITELVYLMRLPDVVSRDFLLKSVLVREELNSTGIGDGVAVPHMRYPATELSDSQVTLGIPAKPVDWKSGDKKPVDIVFLPCCANMRSHLHLLSSISFAVRNPDVRKVLLNNTPRGEILEAFASIELETPETKS